MKIFNKESNTNSKEDTQTGAESSGARNSGSSAEKAMSQGKIPKRFLLIQELKKALRPPAGRKMKYSRTSFSGLQQILTISENGPPARWRKIENL